MPIRLEIHAENVDEFDTLISRFMRAGMADGLSREPRTAAEATMPVSHPGAHEAETTAEPAKRRGRQPAAAKAETADAPAAAADEGKSQEAEQNGAAATGEAGGSANHTVQTPAASSPAADAGEVSMQSLKDAMSALIKAKSASVAMQTLEASAGCKSLTSGSPSVAEKAKDDPAIMKRVYDALNAAAAA